MLKHKLIIAGQWGLRIICGTALCLLLIWFPGDISLRDAFGKSQAGLEPVITTTVDPDAVTYSTFQSHNQKIVANAYGIFMTYLHKQQCCDSNRNFCCDVNDPLPFVRRLDDRPHYRSLGETQDTVW
jgi:hypothetical protein